MKDQKCRDETGKKKERHKISLRNKIYEISTYALDAALTSLTHANPNENDEKWHTL